MHAIKGCVQANHREPLTQQSCVLPRGQVTCRTASRKETWTRRFTPMREMVVDRLSGLLRNLEANRPFRLLDRQHNHWLLRQRSLSQPGYTHEVCCRWQVKQREIPEAFQ